MMIPGGDCAIVLDHPQEGSKSKQKNGAEVPHLNDS
jgi:hypothetical protein